MPKRIDKADDFLALMKLLCPDELPHWRREFRFSPPRRWRFDIADPRARVAVEIDGGAYTQGRHTRGKGFEGDCEKLNAAASAGWFVFRFTPQMLERDPGNCMGDVVAKAQCLR